MIATYARNTSVSVEKTRSELDTLLSKHGATARGIAVNDEAGQAQVSFVLGGLHYRMDVPLPKVDENPEPPPRGWRGWGQAERKLWLDRQNAQGGRERWRLVLLLVKSKLEAVQLGLTSVEREFLPDLVLQDNRTVYQAMGERIQRALASGSPLMLGDGA